MVSELRIEKDLEGSDCVLKSFEVLSYCTETCAVSLCSRPEFRHLLQWSTTFWCLVFVYSRPAIRCIWWSTRLWFCVVKLIFDRLLVSFRHVWCCEMVSVLIAVLFRTHRCCPLTLRATQRVIGAHLPSSEFVSPRLALATAPWQRCTPLLLFHKLC
jgi:hypothetical protein